MGKKFRIRYLIIAFVFILLGVGGAVITYSQKENIVFAAFQVGEGTEENPYLIYNDNQMYSLQEVSCSTLSKKKTEGKYFKLMSNVKGLYRVQESAYGFYGTLDGNGYTITLGGFPLFYVLKDNATVKNATIVRNTDIYNGTMVFSLSYYVNKNAVVENCVFESDINIFVPTNMATSTVTIGTCCVYNNGIIRDCVFNVDVDMRYISEEKHGKFGKLYVCGIAWSGAGEGVIERCKVNGNMSLITACVSNFFVAGLAASKNIVSYSEYNGDITVRYREGRLYPYVYGISGTNANDCTFNGNIRMNFVPSHYGITLKDGTFVHNGEIIIEKF